MSDKGFMDEIVSYIKKNVKKGYTEESLKWALMGQGYSKLEVEKGLKRAHMELAQQAPLLDAKPKITYEIVEPREHAVKVESDSRPLWKKLFFG
tara:strand:- start:11364 stop:11645 length:282 start_codon:yes stop_codon:yes gene_type:complete